MLSLDDIIVQMAKNEIRIKEVVYFKTDEQARWKPDARSWSMLEVINHLLDEEREDFRVRLDYILHKPDQPWPAIDPERWVVERRYNDRHMAQSLDEFRAERTNSLNWLRSLESPRWNATAGSRAGLMRAGDMMASWVLHDILHLQQLVRLERQYMEHILQPYNCSYAGG